MKDTENNRKRGKWGFTLAELLVVVAIITILVGVSFVAVLRYQSRLRRLEMDQTAKEIFLAAQNRLSLESSQGIMARLLEQDGYPLAGGLEAMLDHLASRMAGSGGFPHEVGLFLGYPAEDVEGFRRHGGQGYKYSGLWKVYSDVERAQRCFRQYGCCRRALCRRLEAGCRLVQLFRTA